MWKILLTVSSICFLLALVQGDYTNQVGTYSYSAPPRSQQLYDSVGAQHTFYAALQTHQAQTYHGSYLAPDVVHQTAEIAKQFASPALDNAAFNLALTRQGYTYGNTPAFNAALTASSRSSKTTLQKPSASTIPVIGSLNVKLPLPIGVTPLNIAPLPLQAGTPYANIPNGVTSYGTVYPQKRRR